MFKKSLKTTEIITIKDCKIGVVPHSMQCLVMKVQQEEKLI